jgi:hypothetical protein
MNVREGAMRMRMAAGAIFVLCILTAYLSLVASGGLQGVSPLGIASLVVLPAPILWLAGWIVQGFAEEDDSSATSKPID